MPRAHLLVVLALAGAPTLASANGNVSHQWVSRAAIAGTPVGGSLHGLVSDPALLPMLDTGTMYPDWGYTPGATTEEREAGEASHWEPVQDAYRQWIVANYAPPWSEEARQHLAFYLGLSSHGLADQSYDAMFFERSRFYEPGDHSEFDQDTDVMWAATTGPGAPPQAWVPVGPLLELFASIVGVTIEESSMEQQLGFVGVAIAAVNALATDPVQVADAEADFPWAAAHDDDPAAPGNPPHEAEIVRRYWRSNWALVHGDPVPRPVLWTHPADGGAGHPIEAASIESWVSIVFARALVGPDPDPSYFHLVDSGGAEVPLTLDLFYGDGSHVVHLRPDEDLLPDEVYVVTVDPGLPTIHGEALEGWSFAFSTGNQGPPPVNDDAFWDEPDPYGDEPTGGSTGEGVDESGAEPEAGSTAAVGSSSAGSTGGDTTSPGAEPDDSEPSGCGCSPPRREFSPVLLLGLLLVPHRRRRRRR
ncbi:hypothetical protein [Paraliomyxa miuraensis]|uniref:hypothetical protein n=1 Tax=Paraliomyxa miuraensis TaxID=376150 RepID=UPI00224F7849|nr:hypothetical protein [Paraliomyxa miuraensis]MCX4242806.1 Ig-like domain-containing protein [Paraliomyxa miuraensis]